VSSPLLAIENLVVDVRPPGGPRPPFRAVDDVSLFVGHGETLGLVGESGSGKSTIGRAILGLVEPTAGRISFDGDDVTTRTDEQRKRLSQEISAVFQDPYSSLNPARTVGKSIIEPLATQRRLTRQEESHRISDLLEDVRLPRTAGHRYPHSFSGGQRQRVAIARALSTSPKLVICDEAVSALDVVTRAQILNLFADLKEQTRAALLFIGHDLPVVGFLSERIVVLYRGRVMEHGPSDEILERPLHPYTKALIAAVPVPSPERQRIRRRERQATVSTTTANAAPAPRDGCVFAPRCPRVADICWQVRPEDTRVDGRTVQCHLFHPDSAHPESSRPQEVPTG
jgi:oligopeptide/dipeptide ABC transporter ATP-binding protein